ncbi:DUF3781 domain-containing protein [Liquorilactobacillus uvarum]|uniref:DUF3781 domain-containing protein n=1 Tax=Liquorilactobacillus uvarum TaxID=303240 RepID=UPI002889BBFC|nr:DUF3781 domain-containing protein [Liquorilactobacillus uvarum]
MNNEQLMVIAKRVCYTKRVYQRINKKLKTNYSNGEIELLVQQVVLEASQIIHKGKNFYISNYESGVRVTVNANNYRIITADSLNCNSMH